MMYLRIFLVVCISFGLVQSQSGNVLNFMDDILIDKVSGVVVWTVQLVLGVGGSGPKIRDFKIKARRLLERGGW